MKKKLALILLLMVICLAVIGAVSVSAATSGTCGDGVEWSLSDGILTISGTGAMEDYQGHISNAILPQWYSLQSDIRQIVIEDGVTSVGSYAFCDCSAATSITLPESVEKIGKDAFFNCTGLEKFYWNAKNVVDFSSDNYVFSYAGKNSDGMEVIFGEGVESIPAYAFDPCGSSTFTPNLTGVTIGKAVTSIGNYAFYNCTKLEEIYWNAKNVADFTSGNYIFYNAGREGDGIKVIFGDGVERIPGRVFYPYTVNSNFAPKITSVTIPESITEIGSGAFYDCNTMIDVSIADLAAWCGINFSNWNSNPLYYAENFYIDGVLTTDLVIPDGVTEIKSYAFYCFDEVTGVTIPESVTSIGSHAFSGCINLEKINWNAKNVTDFSSNNYIFYNAGTNSDGMEVVFGDSVEAIPAYAFYQCTGLTCITIGSKITSIPAYAFSQCSALISVNLGGNITCIQRSAFRSCTNLKSITIGSSITEIGSNAFSDCGNLETVYWNAKNVETEGSSVFSESGWSGDGIEVIFGDSVESIPSYAFGSSTVAPKLTSITIGSSVTSIGDYAFYSCGDLESIHWNAKNVADFAWNNRIFSYAGEDGNGIEIVFGDSVERIPAYLFHGSIPVTSIHISDNVKDIGENAFDNTDYYLDSSNWTDGVLYIDNHLIQAEASLSGDYVIKDGTKTVGYQAFGDCSGLTSITIPADVVSIGESAFYGCDALESVYLTDMEAYLNIRYGDGAACPMYHADKLYLNNKRVTSVTIPDGVTQIPAYAFHGCDSLKSVTGGSNVTAIGDYAFYGCTALTEAPIGNCVTNIGAYAFKSCVSMASITIGSSVTTIGSDAFRGCSSLADLSITDLAAWCGIVFSSETSNPLYYAEHFYINGELVADLVIPDSVTTIGNFAFEYCENLASITIGNNVTTIGERAFYYCSALKSITIPDKVTSIGQNAFYGCGLESVVIGKGVTKLEQKVFSNCRNLKSVTIGKRVAHIDSYAFGECWSLTTVVIPKKVTEIEANAFESCSAITTVEYSGSEEEWNEIYIGSGNDYLQNAAIRCLNDTSPEECYVRKSETDTAWIFYVEYTADQACDVYASVYNKRGQLVGTRRAALDASGSATLEVDKTENDYRARIFIWTESLIPITGRVEVEL